jgi:hypothetical protein
MSRRTSPWRLWVTRRLTPPALVLLALIPAACAHRGADRPPLWTEVVRDEVSPAPDQGPRFRSLWGRHLEPTTPSYDPIPGRALPRSRPVAR